MNCSCAEILPNANKNALAHLYPIAPINNFLNVAWLCILWMLSYVHRNHFLYCPFLKLYISLVLMLIFAQRETLSLISL